jgi:hypothetical protein
MTPYLLFKIRRQGFLTKKAPDERNSTTCAEMTLIMLPFHMWGTLIAMEMVFTIAF